jgi:ubiquinone/menaquinone biosynthesis C-methylase UbiE
MFGNAEVSFRRGMVRLMDVPSYGLVLEVGVGTGRNLEVIEEIWSPTLTIYGIDLSPGMLKECVLRATMIKCSVKLYLANAEYLPFRDNVFDSVLHFGFINDLANPERAIKEMVRVAKPGSKVVICDDGFPPATRQSPIAQYVISRNMSFGTDPPVKYLPTEAQQYQVQWLLGSFYVLSFRKGAPAG